MSRWPLAVALLAWMPLSGQPAFEAASVKPSPQTQGLIEVRKESNPGRTAYHNFSLMALIVDAWQVSGYQVEGGPYWKDRERYDVMAAKPKGTSEDQSRLMLQSLLRERFHLALHSENRTMPAYALLAGTDTSKLHPANPGEPEGCGNSGTMADFARMVARSIGKPVTDQTGISGKYDFVFAWSALSAGPAGSGDVPPPPPPPPPPPSNPLCKGWGGPPPTPAASPFEAVRQQMGLRLERRGTARVDVLVIDRAERPSGN